MTSVFINPSIHQPSHWTQWKTPVIIDPAKTDLQVYFCGLLDDDNWINAQLPSVFIYLYHYIMNDFEFRWNCKMRCRICTNKSKNRLQGCNKFILGQWQRWFDIYKYIDVTTTKEKLIKTFVCSCPGCDLWRPTWSGKHLMLFWGFGDRIWWKPTTSFTRKTPTKTLKTPSKTCKRPQIPESRSNGFWWFLRNL